MDLNNRTKEENEKFKKLAGQMCSLTYGYSNMDIMEIALSMYRSMAIKSGMTPENRNKAAVEILNFLDNSPIEWIHIKDKMNEH